MDPREMEALIQRLVRNPHDEEALSQAHFAGQSDPRAYALLLEKVGQATTDPAYAAHWLSEAANVWSITIGDAHHAARTLMAAIDKDPTADLPAERLAALYRDKSDQKALVALLERQVKQIAPLAPQRPELHARLASMHEELGRLWGEPPLSRPERALENWRRLAELDPRHALAIYQARELLKAQEHWSEAVPYFAMELALVDDVERKLALLRDESGTRMRAGDGPGASHALRQARGLRPDDVALAAEFGASVIARVDRGENVSPEDREEARAIFASLMESYDGEYGFSYASSALRVAPGDDRAMQLAAHFAKQLGREAELRPLYAAYLQANPQGYLAAEARAVAGDAKPPPPQAARAPGLPPPPGAAPAAASAPQAAPAPVAVPAPTPSGTSLPEIEPDEDDAPAPPPAREDELRALLDQAQTEAQKGRKPTALAKFREVLKLDPANADALGWVDEHLRQKRMYSDLRDVLLAASRVTSQPLETRRAQLRDVAGLCESQLRDLETAITATKQLVQLDRADENAREQLRRLLERGQRWDELATVLEQDAMSGSDVETKITLEKKLAQLHEAKRKDPASAAEAWARIAALAPSDEAAIQTSVKLFEKAEQFEQAANVIAENVSGVDDDELRGKLLAKLGELRKRAGDVGGAADAFAEAAEAQKSAALWQEAERAYEAAGRWVEAANAVDQRASLESEAARPALFARAAELFEGARDVAAAIDKLGEAVRLDPSRDDWADKLESLLRTESRAADVPNLLLDRSDRATDKQKRVALRFRAAEVQRELGAFESARETLLRILEDGEDARALEALVEDARVRGDHQEQADLLKRLVLVIDDPQRRLALALDEAELYAQKIDEPKVAIDRYEVIVRDLDPKHRGALRAIADLADSIDEPRLAASALEREIELAQGEERVDLAQRLAQLYEGPLDDLDGAMRALDIVHAADPEDFDAVSRLLKLCERAENWERVAKLLGMLIEVEGDETEASEMTRRLAVVLEEKLGRADEALGALEGPADGGDVPARDAYVELGDRLGYKGIVATKLVAWTEGAQGPRRHDALRGAFDRFLEIGREADASRAALELCRARAADRDLGEKLEAIAQRTKDLDALAAAHEVLARDLSGVDRATELVRQAEVMVGAGADALDALQHGEGALASVPPAEVEPLLERLRALPEAPGHVVDLYERQVGRCRAPADRLAALARAAQVAIEKGAFDRARSFFEIALGSGAQEETLTVLEAAARAGDERTGDTRLRRILAESLAAGGQGSRDGGRTRSALLRRAATIVHRELGDVEQAFRWVGDALVTHVDDAALGALDTLGAEVNDLGRVEAVLGRALEEVFDGPLVRKLLARRARLRRDEVGDKQGAAADLKKLHDLSPSDQEVMNELSSLLEELGDHRGRIQLYEDQILRGRDQTLRADLARKVARLWEEELGDAREAADAWRRVLRMKANDPEATSGLERAKSGKLRFDPDKPKVAEPSSPKAAPKPAATPAPAPVAAAPTPAAPPVVAVAPSSPPMSSPTIVEPHRSPSVTDEHELSIRPDPVSASMAVVAAMAATGEGDVFKGIPEETADVDDAEEVLDDVPADLLPPRAEGARVADPITSDGGDAGQRAWDAAQAQEQGTAQQQAWAQQTEAAQHAWAQQQAQQAGQAPPEAAQQAWAQQQAATHGAAEGAQQAWPAQQVDGSAGPWPAQQGDAAQQAAWAQQQQQQQAHQQGHAWPQGDAAQQAWAHQQQQQQAWAQQQGWAQQGQGDAAQQAWAHQQAQQAWAHQQQQQQAWAQQQGWGGQGHPQQGHPQQGQPGWGGDAAQQAWAQQQQQQGWGQQPQPTEAELAQQRAWAAQQGQPWPPAAEAQGHAGPGPASLGQQMVQGWPAPRASQPPGGSKPPPPPVHSSRPPGPGDEDVEDVDDAELIEDEGA